MTQALPDILTALSQSSPVLTWTEYSTNSDAPVLHATCEGQKFQIRTVYGEKVEGKRTKPEPTSYRLTDNGRELLTVFPSLAEAQRYAASVVYWRRLADEAAAVAADRQAHPESKFDVAGGALE